MASQLLEDCLVICCFIWWEGDRVAISLQLLTVLPLSKNLAAKFSSKFGISLYIILSNNYSSPYLEQLMYFPKLLSLALTLPLAIALPTFYIDYAAISGSSQALAQAFPDLSNPTVQLYLQADSLISSGFPEEGIALFERLLQQLQDRGDRVAEADLLKSIASSFETQGDLERALTYYQQALDIYEGSIISPADRTAQLFEASEVLNQMALIQMWLENPEQAFAAYQQAIEINRQANLPQEEASTLGHLGTAYQTTGQTEQALAAYQRAIAIYTEVGSSPYDAPRIFNQIGMIYQAQGQFDQALAAYQQGLAAVAEQSDDFQTVDRVLTLDNISTLYQAQERADLAADYAQQAETTLTQASTDEFIGENLSRKANFLKEVGDFYLTIGQLEQARSYFDRAVAIAGQHPGGGLEYLLPTIVFAYTQQGQIAPAIPYQERYTELVQDQTFSLERATSLASLGNLYQTIGQLEQALTTYQQALTAFQELEQQYGGQTGEIAQTMLDLGSVYEKQGQAEQALATYQQALSLYETDDFSPEKIHLLTQLAQFYEMQGQPDHAQQYSQQAQTLRNQMLEYLSQMLEQFNQMNETQGQPDRTS
ncbi:tetratricopeptide repeat protein [Leptolyngbya sp. FACHB-671]|uniref:tetratricopeptide repeat protein n=1 Tax=Leptolyngbya sp. FACHB-671 TaxID=2692812 RepID=UPI0016823E6D|nr:tetratricopeptide repeat protein [Leptolyngbya sp. FACHB-671]MBD2067194.1 tetratricopeptide repeat protein [Leptolyngbya sp. FACHB-671]